MDINLQIPDEHREGLVKALSPDDPSDEGIATGIQKLIAQRLILDIPRNPVRERFQQIEDRRAERELAQEERRQMREEVRQARQEAMEEARDKRRAVLESFGLPDALLPAPQSAPEQPQRSIPESETPK